MKEKKNCMIVQDLFPNYIEKLTSDETNNFIEEHLKSCNECQKILKNMKENFDIDTTLKNNKEVKYMKRYNNKLNLLKIQNIMILNNDKFREEL